MKCSRALQLTFALQNVQEAVRDGDMAAMMDVNDFNSGFIIVKPTPCSIRVWNGTRAAISVQRTVNDQAALNSVITTTHGIVKI
jgi:hypothetical protein